jgi:hypothetical protein
MGGHSCTADQSGDQQRDRAYASGRSAMLSLLWRRLLCTCCETRPRSLVALSLYFVDWRVAWLQCAPPQCAAPVGYAQSLCTLLACGTTPVCTAPVRSTSGSYPEPCPPCPAPRRLQCAPPQCAAPVRPRLGAAVGLGPLPPHALPRTPHTALPLPTYPTVRARSGEEERLTSKYRLNTVDADGPG